MTTTEAITKTIETRAADILEFVRMGWTKEDAIAHVRQSSTLGPKSWDRVMEIVGR